MELFFPFLLFIIAYILYSLLPKRKHKYCSKCGSKMRFNRYLNYYDRDTGEPKYAEKWECSNDPMHEREYYDEL